MTQQAIIKRLNSVLSQPWPFSHIDRIVIRVLLAELAALRGQQ